MKNAWLQPWMVQIKNYFPFLPYILQDLWKIGADPDIITGLIRKHFNSYSNLKVLDLGCGKGIVSIQVAKTLGCKCHGIDAIPEFIEYARQKAEEFNVHQLCTFETGDIREKIKELTGFDVVILGAIGPVFGDYYSTLTTLSHCIHKKGVFIVDDGYTEDNSDFNHPAIFRKSIIMQQIDKAGMELLESKIIEREDIKDSDDYVFEKLKNRCYELIEKYPDKKEIFLDYVRIQEIENDTLENKITCATMVIGVKTK